jgi:hypothetical protein
LTDKKRRNTKRSRLEEDVDEDIRLLISTLRYLEKGASLNYTATMIGIDEKYLKVWLSVLVHFKCIRHNSAGSGYELTQRGKNLVQSLDMDVPKD